jgi:heterotetrameric sarcosine oxidase gamma subunit
VPETRPSGHGWTGPAPVPRSPLRKGTRATGDEGLAVDDLCLLPKVQVRADDEAAASEVLGARFGRSARAGTRLVCGSGPGEWLVVGPAADPAGELAAELQHLLAPVAGLVTVVDLTHGRALLRLRGPATRAVLSRLTAFDLDDRFVPDGAAWRTSVAGVVTDLVRDDDGGPPSYLLHCERSSGRYLVDTVLAAGADLGAVLDGQPRTTWTMPSTSTTG